jgi:hypothetical protein
VSTLVVPPLVEDESLHWPSLGPELWRWQLDHLVYGPGDLRGVSLYDHPPDEEYEGILHRAYQVYPLPEDVAARAVALRKWSEDGSGLLVPDFADAGQAGRRRFKRVALSVRKGTAKTEKAAWIAAGELHPEAPVRTIGWALERGEYVPVGGPVRDPFVPMVAYTEEQTEELAFGALRTIVEESEELLRFLAPFQTEVVRRDGSGKAVALASSPNSNDGARTTFQHFDETHRMVLDRLKASHQTMQANLPKRRLADAWGLETTTTYAPGEGSVAEGTHEFAEMIAAGKMDDPRLFYFHRQAGDGHKLRKDDGSLNPEGLKAAVEEASGPAKSWSDLDAIVALALDPQTDLAYWERVWLNRPVQADGQAFSTEKWAGLAAAEPLWRPKPKAIIVLGFDGSRTNDATALVATDVMSARQFVLGFWERPYTSDGRPIPGWEVPVDEVDQAVDEAFARWRVWRMYADPPYWETYVAAWEGRHRRKGKPTVFEWWTNRQRPMAYALKAYRAAIETGELSHDGHEGLARHIGNARKHYPGQSFTDETGAPLWTIRKERQESPKKIDGAMAGCLSWEAYRDAVSAGMKRNRSRVPVSV